jgi:hypothetical protein
MLKKNVHFYQQKYSDVSIAIEISCLETDFMIKIDKSSRCLMRLYIFFINLKFIATAGCFSCAD